MKPVGYAGRSQADLKHFFFYTTHNPIFQLIISSIDYDNIVERAQMIYKKIKDCFKLMHSVLYLYFVCS